MSNTRGAPGLAWAPVAVGKASYRDCVPVREYNAHLITGKIWEFNDFVMAAVRVSVRASDQSEGALVRQKAWHPHAHTHRIRLQADLCVGNLGGADRWRSTMAAVTVSGGWLWWYFHSDRLCMCGSAVENADLQSSRSDRLSVYHESESSGSILKIHPICSKQGWATWHRLYITVLWK